MSNDTTDETEERAAPEEQMPEMTTYTLTVTRQFELDLSERQVEMMVRQMDADEPAGAVEEAFVEQERGYIDPEQKLLGIRVNVEGE